jgi:hypothetical protein
MRIAAGLLLAALFVSGRAHAESTSCRDGVLAVTGERTEEVLRNCGYPTWAKLYPGTKGRYRRQTVEVWIYDLGEGTFPRVLRFVAGVLEEVSEVSREP